MFLTQHFAPRWKKEWIPLATQQMRLRNLIKILAFSIRNDKKEMMGSKMNDAPSYVINESYYFTLHATTMSAPFYTSEKVKSDSPKWKEFEISSWEGNVSNSMEAVVIRLWFSNPQEIEDKVLAVWGIYLSGLVYLGPSLKDVTLKPNSIVFLMPGGYFTDPECIESNLRIRYSSVIVNNCDVRPSYTISSLKRLQALQHVIRKEMAEAEILKKKISMGDFFSSDNRGKTALRKLLNKHKPKTNSVDLMKVKENIEITKYRVNILREEKAILLQRIKELNKHIESVSESNKIIESKLLENYRNLKREINSHREWKRSYIDKREKYLHSKARLNFRKKQLISEMNLIYPIVEVSSQKFTICGVHLPNSEDFAGNDDLQISIALGFVTHTIQMISIFMQIPLRYPVIHLGSRSKIIDQITDKISDSEREFCLYIKGKEKLQFHYAVYLLNKNIAQMRWLCGLPTSDLRNTLENLSSLVKLKFANSTLDQNSISLSSSTADICSSNLDMNVTSPLGSVMSVQLKRHPRTLCVSESGKDSCLKTINNSSFHVPGHYISKSVGSSKELMTNMLKSKNRALMGVRKKINNNLSCSLDKGLNEYEETLNTRKKEIELFGSEPTLKCSIKLPKNHIESEVKAKFLQTWKTEFQKIPFSDDDLEVHVKDLSLKKIDYSSSNDNLEKDEFNKFCIDGEQDTGSAVKETLNAFENQSSLTEKFLKVGNENKNIAADKNCSSEHEKVSFNVKNEYQEVDDTIKSKAEAPFQMGDSLLESVANRTEALVHQTTSFNRFRPRLKSTLESSNHCN